MNQLDRIDVLMLYAPDDNEKADSQPFSGNGLISQLCKILEIMLHQIVRRKVSLIAASPSDIDIDEAVRNTTILMPVVTESFIQSPDCLRVLETLFESLTANKQDMATYRIFKILKTRIPSSKQPKCIRYINSYDLFTVDVESLDIVEYANFLNTDFDKNFWLQLVDLAYDVSDSLDKLYPDASAKNESSGMAKKNVYLAEVGYDLIVQRNIIRRELIRTGFEVLPRQSLPLRLEDLNTVVRKNIYESALSIHLIGNVYGALPEGLSKDSEMSTVAIQHRIASEVADEKYRINQDFSQLIWLSPISKSISPQQADFRESVLKELEKQTNTEVLETTLEEFKSVVRQRLAESKSIKKEPMMNQYAYLIYDFPDRENVEPLINVLASLGYQVLHPPFNGYDFIDSRKLYLENLLQYDLAIIYQGQAPQQWAKMKVLDLLKSPGLGREKTILGRALVIQKTSEEKLDFLQEKQINLLYADDIQEAKSAIENFVRSI